MDSSQQECLQKSKELLADSQKYAASINSKLADFIETTKRLKTHGIDGASSVQEILSFREKNRQNLAALNASMAATTGTDTLDKFYSDKNAGQPADPLKKIISTLIQNNSDISGTAGAAAMAAQASTLDRSWRQLDQVKSPLALEHLTNFLDAQEMQLKVTQYQQQMQQLNTDAQTFYGVNDRAAKQLSTAGTEGAGTNEGNADGTHSTAGAGGAVASANGSESSGETGFHPSFKPLRARPGEDASATAGTSDLASSAKAGSAEIEARRASETSETEDATGGSRSGSNFPKPGSALRDALRAKLARKETLGNAGDEKEKPNANGIGGDGRSIASTEVSSKGDRRLAAVAGDAFAGDTFEGSLNKGAFSLRGKDSDQSVKSILLDFASEQAAAEDHSVGPADGQSLFARVQAFHRRYVGRGWIGVRRVAKE